MLCFVIFQGQSDRLPDQLEIIIPGREIPKWFNHECTGHELNIRVPSFGFDELMGIALCVVFVPNEWRRCPSDWKLSCSFNGFTIKCQEHSNFRTKYGIIESHHLWLFYLSSYYVSRCFFSNWGRIFNQIGKGFHQLMIKTYSWSLEVEKIGVRLVYLQDMEDPNQIMAQCSNNSFGPLTPTWSPAKVVKEPKMVKHLN